MKYKTISRCRLCGSSNLDTILDLGNHPLANDLKKTYDENKDKFPLTLLFCPDCSLVQLRETVNKEILFEKYLWVTGTSLTAKQYANTFYNNVVGIAKPKPAELVIEIASNDGTFLKPFINGSYNVIGVDPAKNIAEAANKEGIKTLDLFWDTKTAQKILTEYGPAKIIIARNVVPHVSELNDVIAAIHLALAEDGIGVIEFHYAGSILKELQYDSIYHEHLCYFSIKAMERLLNKFRMFSFHIDLSPISGGAYVIYFSKRKCSETENYRQLSKRESDLSVNDITSWKTFAKKCIEHKRGSKDVVKPFKNKTIVGFGASARSSTYLNFCGFTNSDIKMIIDNNKLKQKLYTAGSNIPIVSAEEGLNTGPELILILAWNFREEIIKECRKKGYKGSYLIPFPNKPVLQT